ncbi:hypothetical protein IMCC3317_37790 [Kordia antarctica]|uniref:Uncharacterized protein n=1 Tax=Kordia antarctica TaxID=1218801 RepID=A0A7L4ZPJ2_9FLAO|nr:hypothetical protein [Kordia antarctica]QHI38387.1 hypothetical protein IMCC3317_37790 [Kordia antarctica]
MKKIITCTFFLLSVCLFSQNKEEIEADYELQGYFKNYQEFNIDSLKAKKFKHIVYIDLQGNGFIFERKLENNLKQTVYTILVNFPYGKYQRHKEYKVHMFSKNDSIIGLISYHAKTGSVNSYFDYKKLYAHIELHNELYETKFGVSDFIDQFKTMKTYGFHCGFSPIMNGALQHDDFYFDNIRNAKHFRKWLKSFNPELQAFGIKALEHLEEKEKLPLSPLEKKLIKHIKTRNSTLLICGGCVSFPRRLYD